MKLEAGYIPAFLFLAENEKRIEVLTEEQRRKIVELMMQSASSKMPKNCSSLYSDCKCVSMFFKDTLGEARTDMTPNDLYKYCIAHASHSMNPHNAVRIVTEKN